MSLWRHLLLQWKISNESFLVKKKLIKAKLFKIEEKTLHFYGQSLSYINFVEIHWKIRSHQDLNWTLLKYQKDKYIFTLRQGLIHLSMQTSIQKLRPNFDIKFCGILSGRVTDHTWNSRWNSLACIWAQGPYSQSNLHKFLVFYVSF